MELYCKSLIDRQRWDTRTVMVGDIGIGGDSPIRVQSMTTTNTMDTEGTIEQSIRMIEAGCEIVRITAPSIKEAKNLKNIRDGLRLKGYFAPIVADIHFTPNAAIIAASIVEKVRINPGNYADRKRFETYQYTDSSYQDELHRIRDRFLPLIKICKENGTAMRIGANHGSLSDRILSRHGDTPKGMVESAMEFLRIADDESYHNIILSMKSSNTQVMVQAYRLLVNKMNDEGMNYPLHLGVTEAGEGEDGRIKSAVGIGTLLEDGLGDTIRVSLTEEPEKEIPVANMLINRYDRDVNTKYKIKIFGTSPYDPFFYERRLSKEILNVGSKQPPRVIGNLSNLKSIRYQDMGQFGYLYSLDQDKWHIAEMAIDFLYIGSSSLDFQVPGTLGIIQDSSNYNGKSGYYPLYESKNISQIDPDKISFLKCKDSEDIYSNIKYLRNCIIILETSQKIGFHNQRRFFIELINQQITNPVLIKRQYEGISKKQLLIDSAVEFGGLQIDGMGDGIWLHSDQEISFMNEVAFGILQACRTRISKTEYISCPSCGRTLFNLQKTTAKIRERTDHLKGIKIGVMGCIVNGPGEMADADYGYVGTGPGLISLYKGQKVVEKNLPVGKAVEGLVALIKSNGDWIEPADV
ncbi:MAG: (E)-4-hydroxy-3-methylbut-2-enyl-diphosphate synthase [Candidatus Neomarinimicrobiota bacterium]